MRKLRTVSVVAAGALVAASVSAMSAGSAGATAAPHTFARKAQVPTATVTGARAATVSTAAKAVRLGASSISWGTCTDATLVYFGAECAMVPVPLDYANPSAGTVQLAISRIKHTVPDSQYQGVMLVNPGGPGGSGQYLSILKYFVPNGAGESYDWIGFDPRGVGSSKPALTCDPNYFSLNRPSYIPVQNSTLQKWLTRSKNYAQSCAKNGPILDHMTTIDAAKDMDSLRAALGAPQINYYGFSYGTYLGQVYATLFPDKLRRAVLDSSVDPRKVWYQANLDQDVAFQKNMRIWWAWLASNNATYHLGATESAVETLFDRIESQLTFHPAKGQLGGDEWVDAFLNAGYYQSTWLDLAKLFSDYVNNGAVDEVVQSYLDANTPGQPGADNGFAVYNAVQCTDTQWPTSWAQWSADNWRVFSQAPFETWANAWFNAPCLYWPAKAHTPVTVDGSTAPPILLIDETGDAATPYPGSLEVRKRFPKSSLIALPGGTSHANSLGGDACLDDQIAAYLANGTLPARQAGDGPDTTCAPLPVPEPSTSGSGVAVAAATPTATVGSTRKSTAPAVRRLGAERAAALRP